MEAIVETCCGLDVHQASVVACLLVGKLGKKPRKDNESAGKRKGHPSRRGNLHLTTALVQAAVAASRAKGTYLKEKYWRLKARRGPMRAAMAIAHKILIAAYHMLSSALDYK